MTIPKREQRVKEALGRIFKARSSVPGIEDLAGKLITAFGGADAFASHFVTVFNTSSPMVKARLLEAATRLIVLTDKTRAPADLSSAGDEELMEIARAVTAHAAEEDTQIGAGFGAAEQRPAPPDAPGGTGGGGARVPQPDGPAAPAADAGRAAGG